VFNLGVLEAVLRSFKEAVLRETGKHYAGLFFFWGGALVVSAPSRARVHPRMTRTDIFYWTGRVRCLIILYSD